MSALSKDEMYALSKDEMSVLSKDEMSALTKDNECSRIIYFSLQEEFIGHQFYIPC